MNDTVCYVLMIMGCGLSCRCAGAVHAGAHYYHILTVIRLVSTQFGEHSCRQVRYALDPLLRALTSYYVDDSDLRDRLHRLFEVRGAA